jgi:hypothetical protein
MAAMLANPFYAIEIDPSLAGPHETIVTEDQWIAAATRSIEEDGAETFLRNLLSVLKGSYPTAAEFGDGPPPDALPGRNESCWCGSGEKFKHCHGR